MSETMTKQGYRDFDLPTDLHDEEAKGHAVPIKSRDEAEIAFRRTLRPGGLVLVQQAIGTRIASRVTELIAAREPDQEFGRRRLAAAAFNSSWYTFARGAHTSEWTEAVTRRRLKLPVHFRPLDKEQVSLESLMGDAQELLDQGATYADRLAAAHNRKGSTILNNEKMFGRSVGRAALTLGSTFVLEGIHRSYSREEQQHQARQGAVQVREDAMHLSDEIGAIPSLAQLADRDSYLSVDWRRGGSDLEVEALDQASTEVFEAAA